MSEGPESRDEARARDLLVDMMGRVARGPHAALGIPTHATAADIRAAFLQLTKQFHPARFGRMSTDTQKLANEVFLGLRGAHDALAKAKPRATPAMLPSTTPVTSTRPTPQSTGQPPSRPSPYPGGSGVIPAQRPNPGQSGSYPAAGHPTQPHRGMGTQPSPTVLRPPAPPQPAVSRASTSQQQRVAASRPPERPTRTPTSSPPPQPGSERLTPAYGVPPPPQPSARSSATNLPAVSPELVPVYDLMQRGQWEQARSVITALSSRSRGAPKYRALLSYTRGRQAQLAGARDDARIELENALQLDPDLQLAKTALAELFARRK